MSGQDDEYPGGMTEISRGSPSAPTVQPNQYPSSTPNGVAETSTKIRPTRPAPFRDPVGVETPFATFTVGNATRDPRLISATPSGSR